MDGAPGGCGCDALSFLSCQHRRAGVDGQADCGRVEQGVVDEAMMDGLLEPRQVFWREFDWHRQFDLEIIHARRVGNFVGGNVDTGTRSRDAFFLQIGHGVVGRARSERREQQFGWRHPLVEAPHRFGLIACDGVLPSLDLKLNRA